MDFELRRAREKLEKEQRERKEKAKLKLQRERKAKQETLRQREAIEATQRQRRLDAAEAESKASQLEEENLLAGRGVNFSRILEAVPYQGIGDKIKLPPSCFTELSEQGAFDKGPLHFSLSLIHQEATMHTESSDKELSRMTHAGVLEFTVEEGFVALPQHCWSNLFPEDAPGSAAVEVRYVWLPKGTYAKLQSVEFGFSDIPNHKAVLETSLRQHATLSQGDTLIVNHGALTYHLRVLELKPSSSISVLETDIEVDIIGPESVDSTNQYILRPLIIGKPEQGMVEEGKYVYYKFSLDDATWKRISSKDASITVTLESQTQDGDTDLYVSRHPLLFPTQHQHMWSSHDLGAKALLLGAEDQNLGPGNYTVAIYGYKGTSKYLVTVNFQDVSTQRLGQHAASSSSSAEVDTLECRNCKRHIPSRTISLHEAYCSRHNIVCQHAGCGVVLRVEESERHVHCEKCSKAFQKEEIEKHMKVFHEPLHCPCGIVLEKDQMVQHQSSDCPLRLITCRFCGDMVQAGTSAADARDRIRGLSEHESVCGSRTAPCDSCGRSVMLKDMDIHQIAVHQKN
ncbi:Ubiquitin fusion degradation UFD1 family protein [Perilla frutescens var. hirtella]|uniref:Ubiquitin fusion degradation UFD1 family protein n=1 Tax=Perilla frutescens var. hirtella TaxID=608512 RepID=A0AAD4JIU4_PERFH|nr:Ubiquitin fusion degradation UFD1 family protein [Perilla frutescens var. hirtella]KAH6834094.1 Ubiquitin fusion degradation UFD1 family protein [Perilla frutescens var. hirtella]